MVGQWTCLIWVGLFQALLPISASTSTTSSPCVDDVASDCWSKLDSSCFGIYEPWSRVHCPVRCGFCGTPPCEDVINYCAQFDHSTCYLPQYAVWARQNCRKTCDLCHQVTPQPNVSSTFEWLSNIILPDNFTLAACAGQDVSLLWKYTKSSDERVVNVEWRFKARGASAADVIATEVNGHFFLEPGNHLNVNYVPNAGIKLMGVTSGDSGTYSVQVNINHQGSMITHAQSANVDVTGVSITSNGQLKAKLLGARYLESTQQHHLLLSCGVFDPLWIPRVSVVWTTPENNELASSFVENDQFILAIPNPLESGVYTCRIDDSSPASVCISSDSPLARGANVTVNRLEGRIILMDSELKMTHAIVSQLQNENANQTIYQHTLEAQIQTLKNENANQADHVHAFETNVQALLNENANQIKSLNGNQTYYQHNLQAQIQGLQNENAAQSSYERDLQAQVHNLQNDVAVLTNNVSSLLSLIVSLHPELRIRLVNGTNNTEGRVEVLIDGVWGTVCEDGFDNNTNAAQVVCRQLGLPYANAAVYSSAHFGEGSGPIHLDYVQCQGTEKTVLDCTLQSIDHTNCSHSEDVGVSCA